MKIEIDVSDVCLSVIEALAENDKRDVGFVAAQFLEQWVNEKIEQSNAMLKFISNPANLPPEKPKRLSIPKSLKQRVFDKSSGNCTYCGVPLVRSGNWHVDHVVPISRGGKDSIENLVASCHVCNIKKGDKPLDEVFSLDAKGK